jgi:hypothetical protein
MQIHAEPSVSIDLSTLGAQFTSQYLDPTSLFIRGQTQIHEQLSTHSVDFPAPLAPTIAIRESSPISKLTFFKICFSGVYPNVTSDIWSSGGEIFSVSGNLSASSDNIPRVDNEPGT